MKSRFYRSVVTAVPEIFLVPIILAVGAPTALASSIRVPPGQVCFVPKRIGYKGIDLRDVQVLADSSTLRAKAAGELFCLTAMPGIQFRGRTEPAFQLALYRAEAPGQRPKLITETTYAYETDMNIIRAHDTLWNQDFYAWAEAPKGTEPTAKYFYPNWPRDLLLRDFQAIYRKAGRPMPGPLAPEPEAPVAKCPDFTGLYAERDSVPMMIQADLRQNQGRLISGKRYDFIALVQTGCERIDMFDTWTIGGLLIDTAASPSFFFIDGVPRWSDFESFADSGGGGTGWPPTASPQTLW